MKKVKLKISYSYKGSDIKTIEAEGSEIPPNYDLDQFIVEQIMRVENPDFVSIYPLVTDIPWGAPAPRIKTNKEAAEHNNISKISYEINGTSYTIKS